LSFPSIKKNKFSSIGLMTSELFWNLTKWQLLSDIGALKPEIAKD